MNPDPTIAAAMGFFEGVADLSLEWSLRLSPMAPAAPVRWTVWFRPPLSLWGQRDPTGFRRLSAYLRLIRAPDAVVRRQRRAQASAVAQGVGVAMDGGAVEWRLYLHGRSRGRATYRSLRWTEGGGDDVSEDEYFFHYHPESPLGLRPAKCAPPAFRASIEHLLADGRAARVDGFWLRMRDGVLRAVDLGFSWSPTVDEYGPAFDEILRVLRLPPDTLEPYRHHHFRHVSFSTDPAKPSVNIYFSAAAPASVQIESAADLSTHVREHAARGNREYRRAVFERTSFPERHDASALATFYGSTDFGLWRRILGRRMHYHFGLFDADSFDPDDPKTWNLGFEKAVRDFYPYLRRGQRVYDVGCGWGGPATMLRREMGCWVTGLTLSRAQYQYCSRVGVPTRLGDAEFTLPPGRFDAALLLESLCHMRNKLHVLRNLRPFADTLLIRDHCQEVGPATAFDGTMHMVSSRQLAELLREAGWSVIRWRNCREESIASVHVWRKRLERVPPTGDAHVETLRWFCDKVLANEARWKANNPLIEVVAV